ncbi:hypothetical protein HLB23_05835 [Nocardia uniformis]|uniref:Uncharacterized protein n=1 Tax=Nocardia uniformis TaxID=53432 RepID=A0A849BZ65_9NOCA|nr:hypothetical protein [Nocardia uniformis]NNH69395.1 hypothetical protein [Nocardia uniformis]
MFILRKFAAAILFGAIAVLVATIPNSAVATADELLPCGDHDRGQTVMWDYGSYLECTDGKWFVRACAPGTTIREDASGNAFCS